MDKSKPRPVTVEIEPGLKVTIMNVPPDIADVLEAMTGKHIPEGLKKAILKAVGAKTDNILGLIGLQSKGKVWAQKWYLNPELRKHPYLGDTSTEGPTPGGLFATAKNLGGDYWAPVRRYASREEAEADSVTTQKIFDTVSKLSKEFPVPPTWMIFMEAIEADPEPEVQPDAWRAVFYVSDKMKASPHLQGIFAHTGVTYIEPNKVLSAQSFSSREEAHEFGQQMGKLGTSIVSMTGLGFTPQDHYYIEPYKVPLSGI